MRKINSDTDYYRRNLPHLQRESASYFVTFRLAGSLPREVIQKLKSSGRNFGIYDRGLDSGSTGPTWLKDKTLAKIVFDNILEEAPRSYHLHCFTVMSNHVHIVLSPLPGMRLDQAMRRIKQPTAFQCNKILGRKEAFWQAGSYDHIIRSKEWERIIMYVLNNPVKAGLITHWREWPFTYLAPDLLNFG